MMREPFLYKDRIIHPVIAWMSKLVSVGCKLNELVIEMNLSMNCMLSARLLCV